MPYLNEISLLIALLLAAGLGAGVIAGLLGVGGGIVLVPVLFQTWIMVGIDASLQMHLAVGTSLAAICVTSAQSTRAHARMKSVDFATLRQWAMLVASGAILGGLVARFVSAQQLTLLFASLTLVLGLRMAFKTDTETPQNLPPLSPTITRPLVALIGFCSALMGIGGGTFSVPLLSRLGLDVHRAVATSAGVGLFIAIPATIGFVISGWGREGLPPFSLGYVNIPAFLVLIPTTLIGAPLGARLAHRLSRTRLRHIFALFLMLSATRMFVALIA